MVYILFTITLLFSHKISSFERFFKANNPTESNNQPTDEHLLELIDYRTPSPHSEPESVFDRPVVFTHDKEPFKNFWEWKAACLQALKEQRCPVTKQQFVDELNTYVAQCKNAKSSMAQPKNWVTPSHSQTPITNTNFLLQSTFEPFVMKLEVDNDEKTAFIGDVHGDIESFNTFLETLSQQGITDCKDPFKVTPKSYVVLLGDYSDRGKSGVEVLYALARFLRINSMHQDESSEKTKNIPKVFALRGNHEEVYLQKTFACNPHFYFMSLYGEITSKFSDPTVFDTIEKFYNYLPLALLLKSGGHAILADHGGIDLGFCDSPTILDSSEKVRYLLIDKLYRAEMVNKFPAIFSFVFKQLEVQDQIKDFDPRLADLPLFQFGLCWTDYEFESDSSQETVIRYQNNRGPKFPEQVTKKWFELNSSPTCVLVGNIRGHQHSHQTMDRILNKDNNSHPEEAGLSKIWYSPLAQQPKETLWKGVVCTLCACPKNSYGPHYDYNFGTYCILQTANNLDQWRLKVHHFDPNDKSVIAVLVNNF